MGGLALVAAIILIGLYLTQYRPPRALVLTVSGRDYDAAAVARRGSYHALFEGGIADAGASTIAGRAVDLLIDEQVLRDRAPAVVGALSHEDVERELAERFGFADPDEREEFAEALRRGILASGLSRDEYLDLATAQLLRERLSDGFREEIGATAPQLRLSRIRVADPERAERVRELALEDGADFAALAREHTVDADHRDYGGDLGWLALDLLEAETAAAVAELQPGEIAPVVASGLFFDVYRVTGREQDGELEEDQAQRLVNRRLDAWLAVERRAVEVTFDLSSGEERWIADRVTGELSGALRR